MTDIYYLGHSCFKIKNRQGEIIIDPFDPEETGLKFPKTNDQLNAVLCTHSHKDHHYLDFLSEANGKPIIIDGPGEFEIAGIKIFGVQSLHGGDKGVNTIYHIIIDGIHVIHLGDLGVKLNDKQIEELDGVDVLMTPIGGKNSFNAQEANEIIGVLEPSIVIPMHYLVSGLKYEIEGIEPFLKVVGAEATVPQAKLSITKDKLPEARQVVVLTT